MRLKIVRKQKEQLETLGKRIYNTDCFFLNSNTRNFFVSAPTLWNGERLKQNSAKSFHFMLSEGGGAVERLQTDTKFSVV